MRYSALLLLLLVVTSSWAQDTTRVKKINTELSKIASQTKNNGKWIFIKPEQKIKPDAFLKNKKALNLSDKSSFKKLKATPLKDAYAMEKHQQFHNNIRIVDAITVLYINDGNVERVQGNLLEDKAEQNSFKLTNEEVIAKAMEQIPSKEYAWQNTKQEADLKTKTNNPAATNYPQPEKVYFEKDGKLFAAYELWIVSNKPSFSYKIILDAETGLVLRKLTNQYECFGNHAATKNTCTHSEIEREHHKEISKEKLETNTIEDCQVRYLPTTFYGSQLIYTYPDDEKGNYRISSNCNTIAYNVSTAIWNGSRYDAEYFKSTLSNNQKINQRSNTTLYGIQKTTEFYKLKFNRNGYNNNYGDLDIKEDAVFEDNDGNDYYNNASFNWTVFGNNEIRLGNNEGETSDSNTSTLDDWNTIDCIGHEFTHGVIGAESNLKYEGESGALNESFADIFGNLIEIYVEGEKPNSWDCLEDKAKNATKAVNTGAIRRMSNPKAFKDPDTYKGEFWQNTALTDDDNGGVHKNSGVQNYFFYLLCKGGKGVSDFNYNFDVSGVGIEIGQFLAYKTLQALTSNSTYFDAQLAWLIQAEIHYGKCSPVYIAVKEAWTAVGVNSSNDLLKFCDTTVDLNNHAIPGINNSLNQTLIGGEKSPDINCETQITNSGAQEEILQAARVIFISGNTTISGNGPIILKTSDPCNP